MPRVLVMTYEYPPIGGGGGAAARDICLGLARRGYEMQVLTSHWGDLPHQEVQEGVTIHRVFTARRLPYKADILGMGGYVLAGILRGLPLIKNWKPDLIHVHFAVPSGAAVHPLHHLTGVPYVLTAHLGDVPGGVPDKTDRWFRFIYPFTPPIWKDAAAVVAVSEHTKELALKHYPRPMKVIPNGIDLKTVAPQGIAINHPPRIVFAGRFTQQKNPLLIIQTLAALRDLPWRCVLIGDGALRPQMEQLIAGLGLQDRFQLTGWLTPKEVLDWFDQSDILFMPSQTEGLPVVGVQALAMGLAIVISNVGGCADLVEEGMNGYLLDKDDAPGFERSLRALLTDMDKLYFYRQTSRALASRFDIELVANAYDELFKGLLQK